MKAGDFYTGTNRNGPYAGDSIKIAKEYAKGGGLVCRFVYDSAAKVISSKDIARILKKYFEKHPEYKDAESDAKHKFFSAQGLAVGTDAYVGRLLGYDVILANNVETGEIHACAVLNRGVLTIDSKKCEIKKSKTKKLATKKAKPKKSESDAEDEVASTPKIVKV
ncbi:hypothetical protein FACS189481_0380 [Clostridia bacterium]|nr:hypothetical protein FACS189481_0380 [Clostridia bacterium]